MKSFFALLSLLILTGCTDPNEKLTHPPSGLADQSYELIEVVYADGSSYVAGSGDVSLSVKKTGQLSGQLLCNTYSGTAIWDKGYVEFEKVNYSVQKCATEAPFRYDGAYTYFIKDNSLVLFSHKEGYSLIFRMLAPKTL